MSNYVRLTNFGTDTSPLTNPLTYCVVSDLDNSFIHTSGQKRGPYSDACQNYMANYCSNVWDGVCEYASKNNSTKFGNPMKGCYDDRNASGSNIIGSTFTQGENLIRNAAAVKYLSPKSKGYTMKYEPFDPIDPNSPLVPKIIKNVLGEEFVPIYEVNPETIDKDPVMNKILQNPSIAMDILVNIFNNARRNGTLEKLKNTNLYNFFMTNNFQKIVNQGQKQFMMRY